MNGKSLALFAAAMSFAMTATIAAAAGPGGFGGGGGGMPSAGGMGFSGLAISPLSISRVMGGRPSKPSVSSTGVLETIPFPTQDPNHYHEIKLIGRFTQDESGLTVDRQLVRMRVDGRSIPMSIDGDQMSNSLQFDQGDELGQNLYRLILSKQLEVVGNQQLRARIADAAAANRSKQIVVDGFVYDRTTPYLVLVSVGDAP
ncbi:MAG TPA: hypothetical protein VK782_06530 [Candidatus Sulfotelmatobacter sp.]|jgi:hypothetical protein|nr:hypothetical protein [Candidatus Sulfotelmatobacter sp.]